MVTYITATSAKQMAESMIPKLVVVHINTIIMAIQDINKMFSTQQVALFIIKSSLETCLGQLRLN